MKTIDISPTKTIVIGVINQLSVLERGHHLVGYTRRGIVGTSQWYWWSTSQFIWLDTSRLDMLLLLYADLFGDGHVWCSAFSFWNIDFSNRKKSLEFLEYPSIKLQESEFLESGNSDPSCLAQRFGRWRGYIAVIYWLVVWKHVFFFHHIWDNPSIWLSYFSRWLFYHQPVYICRS